MSKKSFAPGTMLNPVPVIMATCGDINGDYNVITIAWTGIVNTDPPMTYISVRENRHSFPMIRENKEFVINLVTKDLVKATDWCGVRSADKYNKFKETGLTAEPAQKVKAPLIAESPVNLECVVKEEHSYGTHHMFVAEIVNVNVDEDLLDANGKICLEKAGLVAYSHGEYYGLEEEPVGSFGYSVMKPSTRKRREKEAAAKRRNAQRMAKKRK